MQGLKLQQISLVVAAIVVVARLMFLVADRPIAAGVLLALGTIKPQLVMMLLIWLEFGLPPTCDDAIGWLFHSWSR